MVLFVVPLEWCVRRIVRERGEPLTNLTAKSWLRIAMTFPLAQMVHFRAMTAAFFARTHLWRGVRYQFHGSTPVRVIEDQADAA